MTCRSVGAVLLIAPLVLASAACTDQLAGYVPPPMNPTSPTVLTETFTGSLAPASSAVNYHTFIAGTGNVTAKFTAISPDGTTIGVGLGIWNGLDIDHGLTCTIEEVNAGATTANTLLAVATHGVYLCAEVYDNGTLTTTANYTLQVTHF